MFERQFADAPVKGFHLKCGIYPVTDRTIPVGEMCDRAKLAMTSIKRRYGVYYAVYCDEMLERVLREHQLRPPGRRPRAKRSSGILSPRHNNQRREGSPARSSVRWNNPTLRLYTCPANSSLFSTQLLHLEARYYMLRGPARYQRWLDRDTSRACFRQYLALNSSRRHARAERKPSTRSVCRTS